MSRKLGSTDLKRLNRTWRRATSQRLALILDDVETPFNVGAIVRTAAALRVDQLWVAGRTPLPTHAKAEKTGLGTERLVPWAAIERATDAVAAARSAGYTVVAVELTDDAVPLFAARLSGDVCLVVGHEDRGVSTEVLDTCDAVAFAPQPGKVGSLNVATAAALALYEARRQAWS